MKNLAKYVALILLPLAFSSPAYSINPTYSADAEPNQLSGKLENKTEGSPRRRNVLGVLLFGSGYVLGYSSRFACENSLRKK